jgi:diguanylate cyclase (GGDEF)-like protein/putative nucleotidyltransferase with HDIG domain
MKKSSFRAFAYAVAFVAGTVSLVCVCAVALSAASEARGTSHRVAASTNVWNAYQQARYSVVQEALLVQDFRLAASPYFEGEFDQEARRLEVALGTVERAAPTDTVLIDRLRRTNTQLAEAVRLLVDAVNLGNARRAERIASTRLDRLFSSAIAGVDRGADAHRAESRVGLVAAERAEATLRRSAVAIVLLGVLVAGTALMAIRFRRRLDEARRHELERLRSAAFTDSLTGVLNHRAFQEDLATLLETPTKGESLALLMLDVDGLKRVNDRYGHQAGDDRIKLVASAAASTVSDSERLYRLGGDEFAVVLRRAADREAVEIAEQIHEEFERGAPQADAGFSVGIAAWEPGVTKDELVRRADLALIEAKRLNQVALMYTPAFEIAVAEEPVALHHVQVLANALARAVDTKDAYTHSHCETVAELCALMAVELGLERERVFKVRLAGLLHDVGKIGVPDSILQKPGRLTTDEFDVMKMHPTLGAHILGAAELHEEAAWVLAHHERPDGRGYPEGRTATPLEARVISVADAFEAMVSARPYREARSPAEALVEVARCSGTQFDPVCVRALSTVLGMPLPATREPERQPTLAATRPLPLGAAA